MVQEIKKFFILLAIVLPFLAGCTGLGTETGNPFSPTETGNPSASPCPAFRVDPTLQADTVAGEDEVIDTEFDVVIEYICLRIFICDSEIHTLDCIDALNGIDGDQTLAEFGLSEDLWTVEKLHAALTGQNILTDATALADCKDDILAVDCEEVTLNVDMDDFSEVENIIPNSCVDVFDDGPNPDESPNDGAFDPCI
jgi:hypothetical protein